MDVYSSNEIADSYFCCNLKTYLYNVNAHTVSYHKQGHIADVWTLCKECSGFAWKIRIVRVGVIHSIHYSLPIVIFDLDFFLFASLVGSTQAGSVSTYQYNDEMLCTIEVRYIYLCTYKVLHVCH